MYRASQGDTDMNKYTNEYVEELEKKVADYEMTLIVIANSKPRPTKKGQKDQMLLNALRILRIYGVNTEPFWR